MNREDWIYIIGIVALVLVSLLCYADKVSEANLMEVFTFVLGAVLGGLVTYFRMRGKG